MQREITILLAAAALGALAPSSAKEAQLIRWTLIRRACSGAVVRIITPAMSEKSNF
jgi:hypothetical protein